MARTKNSPEAVKTKHALAQRLRALRTELFGERGGPEMARRLGIPVRTWYNYESGITVPAEVVLRVVEMTGADPTWLLHGTGPKLRETRPIRSLDDTGLTPAALIRAALAKLEQGRPAVDHPLRSPSGSDPDRDEATPQLLMIGVEEATSSGPAGPDGPRFVAARREWFEARAHCRCVRVEGQAMAPIIADGAYVAFHDVDEPAELLEGKLVVAWHQGRPIVRWFQNCGGYALLRAENPAAQPSTILVELEGEGEPARFRRVLWISTGHA